MLPQAFLERMQGLLGSEYEEFLASFDHEKYQALRLNPLKLRAESGRTDDSTVIEEKLQQTFRADGMHSLLARPGVMSDSWMIAGIR